MINVVIYKKGEELLGFAVTGHSMSKESGKDVVCAAVSSAVQMTVNAVAEIAKSKYSLKCSEKIPLVELVLECKNELAEAFLKSFEIQILLLYEDYRQYMTVIYSEE